MFLKIQENHQAVPLIYSFDHSLWICNITVCFGVYAIPWREVPMVFMVFI